MNTENSSKLGSNFPTQYQELLQKTIEETPGGCGGCVHAEWVNNRTGFTVGACRIGIKLAHSNFIDSDTQINWSTSGYTPAVFCTAQNAKI